MTQQPDAPQFQSAQFRPNFVPEAEPEPAAPAASINEELITGLGDITLGSLVSVRTRIVNHVAKVFEEKLKKRPTEQELDSLRARLDEQVPLTTAVAAEVVADWIFDMIGGQMA
jgi:hypothetical protein